MKRNNKLSITTPLLAATTVLLIAANVLLGGILMQQSRRSMQSLIRARMLDISNTAADMLDGDVMRDLTPDDIGTPEYNEAMRILRSFQDNIELEYIYGIRDEGGRFSFTIDPSDDPGEFGESIAYTKALDSAAHGTADVDEEPYSDRWGRFYSAYSPIFDSSGRVAGIVGVDFSAEWYETRIKKHLAAVIIVCSASTLIGIILAFTVTSRIRRRFNALYDEMNDLAADFEDLNKLIAYEGDDKDDPDGSGQAEGNVDEISMLGRQVGSFRKELRHYITYVHSQAYTDAMTGVGNKTAYLKKVKSIEKQLSAIDTNFTVFVFDINGLKTVNDNYGHEIGDRFISEAAAAISSVFGAHNVFRIGGDEFIAVTDGKTPERINALFERLDYETQRRNELGDFPITLSISKGAAVYDSLKNEDYKNVFKRADESMYADKAEFYRKKETLENGDRQ